MDKTTVGKTYIIFIVSSSSFFKAVLLTELVTTYLYYYCASHAWLCSQRDTKIQETTTVHAHTQRHKSANVC